MPLSAGKPEWPKDRAARTQAVQQALAAVGQPATPAEIAERFHRGQKAQIEEILAALVSLGLAHRRRGGKYEA